MKKKAKIETTEIDNKPKKKISKKSVIAYSVTGAAVISVGVVAGILLGQNVFKVDAYRGLNADAIEKDYSPIYEEYKKTNKNQYLSKFTAIEIANISLLKLGDMENYYTITEGSVEAAGVKQTIHGTTIKAGNRNFEESLSASSFVKAANRFYQEDDSVEFYKGKYVDLNGGDYSGVEAKKYSAEQFEAEWGKTPSRPCVYIISERSCLGSEIKDSGDTYQITLDLHPTYSVLRYVQQMTVTGGLSQAPVFHSVKLIFEVDKELTLQTFKTDEVYDVHMVIDAKNSKGSITQTYHYEPRDIPQIEEPTNYL